MNFLDLIILVPLVWCGLKGIRNGLVMEVVSLLALVAGTYISLRFSYLVIEWFNLKGRYAQSISFGIMFAAVSAGLFFLGKILSRWANRSSLGLFNRVGGLVISFGKVLVILSLMVYIWNKIDPGEKILKTETRNASFSFRFVEKTTYKIWPLMQKGLEEGAEGIKQLHAKEG